MAGVTVRALTEADDAEAWELGRLAFGSPKTPPAGMPANVRPGRRPYGAFDARGRMVAKAVDLEHGYVYGARSVPGAGIAGVAVSPESRGAGLLRVLLGATVAAARGRGAAVSALFPTTAVPYRRLGWELAGALTWWSVPTSSLAGLRVPDGTRLRPAEEADVAPLIEAYLATTREGAGLLDRAGPVFGPPFARPPAEVLAAFDGITVAEGPDGDLAGYASWDRGEGYDPSATLSVYDLVGRTADATRGLLAMLGSWRSVAPTLHLRLPDPDPAWLLAGMAGAQVLTRQPWMFRVLDAAAAVAARGWPPHLTGSVGLRLEDDLCPWNAGVWRLRLADGQGRLEPGGSGGSGGSDEPGEPGGSGEPGGPGGSGSGASAGSAEVRLGPNGLALLYSGAATPALLRRSGLLTGGGAAADAFLAAACAGPPPTLLDYF